MTAAKPHIVYLHGFGSSPHSAKAAFLRGYLGERIADLVVPQLDGGDFGHLTFDAIRERALAAIAAVPAGEPLVVVGSSLGGYTAAWLAGRGELARVGGMLLLAPAFGFPHCWRQLLGEEGVRAWREQGARPFFHHGAEREIPVWSRFLDSCEALPDLPPPVDHPIAIVHGTRDETVSWQWSRRYAERDPRIDLRLVDDEHRLDSEPAEQAISEAIDRVLELAGAVC